MSKKTFKIKPRYDRVLVEQRPEEEYNKKFHTKLIVPDIAKGTAPIIHATVIEMGEKCEGLEKGMVVGFQNGAGMEYAPAGENVRIVRDQDIIAIVEE